MYHKPSALLPVCRTRPDPAFIACVCVSPHTYQHRSYLHSAHRLESTLGPSTMSRQRSEESVVLFGGFEVDISQFDLGDRSSRVSSVKIANIIFIILVVLIVSLRIFARVRYVRRIFADDGMCMGLGQSLANFKKFSSSLLRYSPSPWLSLALLVSSTLPMLRLKPHNCDSN
jgi:hypothetical protein